MYKELLTVFKNARSRVHRVDINWIWCKARKIYREQTKNLDAVIRKHVIVNFIKRHNLKLRARQRNRRRSKESFRKELQKWHQTTRERLVRKGLNDRYDAKWGRFLPKERFNVDQSPLPFSMNVKKTYEQIEKGNPEKRNHKVWISQPGSGLDKRQ